MTALYVDVSHYDRDRRGAPLDWAAISAAGLPGVMLARASYGDPQGFHPETRFFREHQAGAEQAGYQARGAYHNLIHGDAACIARQVDYLRSEMDAAGSTFAMLDVEPYEALKANGLYPRWSDVLAFHDRWAQVDTRVLCSYIAQWVWSGWLGSPDLTQLPGPLTNANYPAVASTHPEAMYATAGGDSGRGWAPYGGRTPDVWQFTSRCPLSGASALTDINAYRGSTDELIAMLGGAVASNPNPTHITDEMWWFIEQLDLLDGADTVYAGSWGDFKPGYHCDAFNLWWHKDKSGAYIWRNDYSTKLPADQVLGTPLEHYGAAVDLTFKSAQAGNPTVIRKYGSRVRTAWVNHDPRLKGWREVLIQGDADAAADGYDFVSWTERTPDSTHTWHGHFSALRAYLRQLSIYQAMLSILRGETLAQWQATKGADMPRTFLWQNKIWISRGDASFREVAATVVDKPSVEMNVINAAWPGIAFPSGDANGLPTQSLESKGWDEHLVDTAFGKIPSTAAVVLTPEQIEAVGKAIANAVPSAAAIAEAVADEDHRRSEA